MEHEALTLVLIAVMLILAKLSGLIERAGQPTVLGELLVGVILGNLVLIGIPWFEPIKSDELIAFLAELGVIFLLFQVGLESNITEMRRVGISALLVAVIGVVVPFVLGTYVVGPWLLPDLPANTYLFLGATLTATSVGITARVFQDLGVLRTSAAKIVLGAAVIDDVIGLVILAVVSAIVSAGSVSVGEVGMILLTAIAFLGGSIVLGQMLAPYLGGWLSRVHPGIGMKFAMAISFCLALAYMAQLIGLAPIVGAFAAGLILDAVHFRTFDEPEIIREVREAVHASDQTTQDRVATVLRHHGDKHVEHLVEPIGHFLAPLFFVYTGMSVQLQTLFNPSIMLVAITVTIVAFIGKIVSGLVVNKHDRWLVGWGMVPRGEVGLIFVATGQTLGVISPEIVSVIVIMVILSTLCTPPILTLLVKRSKKPTDIIPEPQSATP
ncbi:MAG: Kef-type K+ transport system, membrane component KefB [Chloroflexi bacterium AL-W]|nr:Kef-type K+ transport system, membrane component KefB [Chloroflexi bacterium AL-N1]NOK69963.1 Kef-type K+ transport system, membrane component KefB [Chloroflexi bacterium AL-N10]NOK73739.1 Kef-type K+ transport system, membrane component KefB [Chloroflexi bacterium AL-N5]NOK85495.1 Kef-type K+ transport system, membrane component KefB [Chloroflexi bacterium AL-W]NOK91696.1 Kef-type K+ transport system, membrane component KefB [Chloroflexi bacterium AL-N15]